DLVYENKTTGTVVYATSTGQSFGTAQTLMSDHPFTLRDANAIFQVGDFRGNGMSGFGVFNPLSGAVEIVFALGIAPDLLATTSNGVGGATTLTYQPSSHVPNHTLAFTIPVVTQTDASDGLGHTYTTTYAYRGGLYDAATKEFRGFQTATVTDAAGTATTTTFSQDLHTKGRPLILDVRDREGRLFAKTTNTYHCTEPFSGVHLTLLDQTDAFLYDGDDTFHQTRSRFLYDAYGNLTTTAEDGQVAPPVVGDERTTTTTFLYNPTAWILNKPSLTQTLDATGAVMAQHRFFYDGAASHTTAPTVGALTKEEAWLNLPTEQWLPTTLTYDTYGNVQTVTDALSRTTTNTYDPTGTYLIQIRNALGHTRQLAYDPRLGQVTSSTDQNTQTTTTQYDPLGRVLKVIGPTDTATLPTIRYAYDLSTVPTKATVITRIQSGQPETLTVYTFTDGLGRTLQTRAPAEDPTKQVITGAAEFDARGLVTTQWVSYLSAVSSSYVPLSLEPSASSLAAVSYSYDAMGRLLTTTDPDGSTTSTRYDDGTVTVTDALGHQTSRVSDAYGRLTTVEEFTEPGTAMSTTYTYDALNRLTDVLDASDHPTHLTYDSLGRKLSMDDPDMGHWTYAYDTVDNLTSQTDARGVTITLTYDALNRLTRKEYLDAPLTSHLSPVTYTYDNPLKSFSTGKLTEITDGSGSSAFEYDTLGRLIKESKTIDGTTSTIQRTYDLLGRLLTLTYPDTEVASYTYNPQGGIETIDFFSPLTQSLTHLLTDVQYNAAGQLTKITYGNGTVSDYTYNPQTLRLSQLSTHNSQLQTLQDFSYTFDPIGNVTAIADHVHTATQSFQYDALNRLTQAVGSYGTSLYTYDPIGNMTSKEGATMTYGLPDGSKPHAVTAVHSPQSRDHRLSYDANGNMIENTIDYGLSTMDYAAQRLTYDAENRLTEVQTAPEETVTLHFEPGWNFFSLPVIPDDPHITAIFPTFSPDFWQIAWFDAALSTPTDARYQLFVNHLMFNDFDTLQYGQGYQLYCENPTGVTITLTGKLPTKQATTTLLPGWHLLPAIAVDTKPLSWLLSGIDAEQIQRYDTTTSSLTPPTEAKPGEAYFVKVRTASTWTSPLPREVTTQFVYDGDGGRIKSITDAGTTTFLGASYELAPDGTTTKHLFAGSQRIAAKDSTGALRFYYPDHLGSTNVLTDAMGAMVELAEYTPYGSLTRREGPTNVPQQFTGQRFDSASGLYFYHARYYDPSSGRFIQADTIVPVPGDPQALNRYTYVRNNPIRYVDPSGHGWFKKFSEKTWDWFQHITKPQWDNPWWWLNKLTESPIAPGTTQQFNQAVNTTATFLVNQWGFSPGAANATIAAVLAIPSGGSSFIAAGLAYGTTELLGTGEARQILGDLTGFFEELGVSHEAAVTLATQVVSVGMTVAVTVASASARALYNKLVHYDVTWAKGGAAVDKKPGDPPVKGALNIGVSGKVNPRSLWGEGGYVSRAANNGPGFNAVSGMHDMFQIGLNRVGGPLLGWTLNVPGMPPAAAITYLALLQAQEIAAIYGTGSYGVQDN
ncbi:MAG: hypothetical protein HYZ89_01680, partial [Candidatus Omnitrophica bacterium]|nr:hypothetical protein [Candidatus Omnitrophota bacterium]